MEARKQVRGRPLSVNVQLRVAASWPKTTSRVARPVSGRSATVAVSTATGSEVTVAPAVFW